MSIKEEFKQLQVDAVLWKSQRLWREAYDPDEQAGAMDKLVAMLLSIANETKRNAYGKNLCDAINRFNKKTQEDIKQLAKSIDQRTKNLQTYLEKKEKTEALQLEIDKREEELEADNVKLFEMQRLNTAPISEKDVRKQVADAVRKKEKAAEAAKMKAKFENGIKTLEDAGLPEDFQGSKQDIYDALKYGIYVHEEVYYTRGGSKGGDYAISNFTMKILYHVDTSDEQAYRLIAVKNVYGFETVINLNTDDFVALGSFKKVLARRGDYVFKGSDSDLTRLQEYLQKDEVKTIYVKTLGFYPRGNFWCWANGIMPLEPNDAGELEFLPIDEYGIVTYQNRNYFIPACSKMYAEKDEQFVNEKKFRYTQLSSAFGFRDWSELMYKAYGKKAIAAILFYIGAIYRDITMKQIQRFPLLNLFGPPGAGKGTLAESLMCMFGERQDQIMLGGASTVVGFMRKFAQFRNSINWLDEYKNNLPIKFIESFKNLYDGKGYERGKMTNDFSTESTPIHSSCILSGQDMPTQEPALFMRCIMLAFEQGKFSADQRDNYKVLLEFEREGLSSVTTTLLKHRSIIQNHFKERYQLVFKQTINEVANVEVDDRMIVNISILLTFMHLLEKTISFPFTYQEAKTFMIENMMQQHSILAGNNDVSKFWGVVESMFYMDIIHEDRDFMLEDGFIYLRLQQVHPLYVKELKNRGDLNFLSKSTIEHYLKLDNTVYVDYVRKRFKDGSNTWTYKMKYVKLGIDLIKIKETHLTDEQKTQNLKMKYAEMGVTADVGNVYSTNNKTPF